jgi:hypothetical protein
MVPRSRRVCRLRSRRTIAQAPSANTPAARPSESIRCIAPSSVNRVTRFNLKRADSATRSDHDQEVLRALARVTNLLTTLEVQAIEKRA